MEGGNIERLQRSTADSRFGGKNISRIQDNLQKVEKLKKKNKKLTTFFDGLSERIKVTYKKTIQQRHLEKKFNFKKEKKMRRYPGKGER